MTDTAIKVEGLSKLYRIGAPQAKYRTFRGSVSSAVSMPVRAFRSLVHRNGHSKKSESIWALKDVSFEIKRGEVVGVVGRNGAGKSTLLNILSRITDPTRGLADIYGRVGSLLEVGTGFHPELTGRENTYLNGAILGMGRKEIDEKFDEIIAFAEIDKFIDTPVKHYSTGMYLRLAFAVAAHLETEILLVDEVLAVGDAVFQKKCLGKMGDVAKEGRTVLFVSHNMGAVTQLCGRGILLELGQLVYEGSIRGTVDRYLRADKVDGFSAVTDTSHLVNRWGTGQGRIVRVELEDDDGHPTPSIGIGHPFSINLSISLQEQLPSLVAGVEVKSLAGVPLVNLRSDSQGIQFGPFQAGSCIRLRVKVPGLPFYPGIYSIEPWFAVNHGRRVDHVSDGVRIVLESKGLYDSEMMLQDGRGLVVMDCEWMNS